MQMLQLMWLCQPPCLLPKQHKPLVFRLVVSLDQCNQCTCSALSLPSSHSAHQLPPNTLLPLVHPGLQTLACTLGSSPSVDLLEIIHCSWDLYTHNCSMFSNWNISRYHYCFTTVYEGTTGAPFCPCLLHPALLIIFVINLRTLLYTPYTAIAVRFNHSVDVSLFCICRFNVKLCLYQLRQPAAATMYDV